MIICFTKNIFSNKFNLFWTTTLSLYYFVTKSVRKKKSLITLAPGQNFTRGRDLIWDIIPSLPEKFAQKLKTPFKKICTIPSTNCCQSIHCLWLKNLLTRKWTTLWRSMARNAPHHALNSLPITTGPNVIKLFTTVIYDFS